MFLRCFFEPFPSSRPSCLSSAAARRLPESCRSFPRRFLPHSRGEAASLGPPERRREGAAPTEGEAGRREGRASHPSSLRQPAHGGRWAGACAVRARGGRGGVCARRACARGAGFPPPPRARVCVCVCARVSVRAWRRCRLPAPCGPQARSGAPAASPPSLVRPPRSQVSWAAAGRRRIEEGGVRPATRLRGEPRRGLLSGSEEEERKEA